MMMAKGGAPALMRVDLRGNPELSAEMVAELSAGLAMARPSFEFVLD
jgi:hypothetical protein|eukprot:COSAG06_NODE_4696_length_4031_cov_3.624110_4_plen_47_part_00